MGVWDTYINRVNTRGATKRRASLNLEKSMLNRRLPSTLSYCTVPIDDIEQNVAVINSDNLNEKFIFSLPDEDILLGGLVEWMGNHWLITEKDANCTIYAKAKMVQCNHLLKWITPDKVIHEQWCIIEDGTKYMSGEIEDRNYIVTRGDSRIAMTIAKNKETSKFNRESRFLIDDVDSEHKLSYLLTKPLKLGGLYNDIGVFKFVLQEVTATCNDNHEIGVADYYKYFPKDGDPGLGRTSAETSLKEVWL